jgi:predicted adenylyl cyclase CyaB
VLFCASDRACPFTAPARKMSRPMSEEHRLSREIETKFRLDDPTALRRRLAQLGATRIGAERESNFVFDTAGRRLLGSGCGLRVRIAHPLEYRGLPTATLTYKGPRDRELASQGVKSREELETELRDGDVVIAILEQLGYRAVVRYQKRRESWRFGGCLITLDELPQLGWFTELEGPDVATLAQRRIDLGLGTATVVVESYVELAAQHGQLEPDGARDLRFVE